VEWSFTAHMPLPITTTIFKLGKRRWSSPRWCYLLHTVSKPPHSRKNTSRRWAGIKTNCIFQNKCQSQAGPAKVVEMKVLMSNKYFLKGKKWLKLNYTTTQRKISKSCRTHQAGFRHFYTGHAAFPSCTWTPRAIPGFSATIRWKRLLVLAGSASSTNNNTPRPSIHACSDAVPGKSASKSDRSETQNLNPMEVDFSWLHHIPKQHHHVLLSRQWCNCLANLHPNLTDLKHKI